MTPRAGPPGDDTTHRAPASARRAWQTPPVTLSAPSSPNLAVRTEGLGRRFGERRAVRDLSLELCRGEVFGLPGPNGAGKTTTIRLLAALVGPSAGRARVDGPDLVRDAHGVRAERIERFLRLAGLQAGGRLFARDAILTRWR